MSEIHRFRAPRPFALLLFSSSQSGQRLNPAASGAARCPARFSALQQEKPSFFNALTAQGSLSCCPCHLMYKFLHILYSFFYSHAVVFLQHQAELLVRSESQCQKYNYLINFLQ